MFTGIIEAQGTVAALRPAAGPAAGGDGARLVVAAPAALAAALRLGDSVAVNGCCLTVVELTGSGFAADLVAETLHRTALGGLAPGDRVNLERPLAVGDRLGGHIVQGHVDGVGRVLARTPVDPEGSGEPPGGVRGTLKGCPGQPGGAPVNREGSVELRVRLDPALARYLVEKGSVAVDGVSLTVARVGQDWFTVALIPHTLAVTTLGGRRPGDPVHLEVDVLAKYVERLLVPYAPGAVPARPGGAPA